MFHGSHRALGSGRCQRRPRAFPSALQADPSTAAHCTHRRTRCRRRVERSAGRRAWGIMRKAHNALKRKPCRFQRGSVAVETKDFLPTPVNGGDQSTPSGSGSLRLEQADDKPNQMPPKDNAKRARHEGAGRNGQHWLLSTRVYWLRRAGPRPINNAAWSPRRCRHRSV